MDPEQHFQDAQPGAAAQSERVNAPLNDAYATAEQQVSETASSVPAQGIKALTAQDFDMLASVGGVRGLVEAVAPGLIYLLVYVTSSNLTAALISSLAVAFLLVTMRLIQRTPVTMAFSGVFGVAIGLFVAWRSGEASDFYVWGLLVNIAYLAGLALTNLIRWPGVGVLVELLQSGFGVQERQPGADHKEQPTFIWPSAWRKDPDLMRRYTVVTWIWVAMFTARLLVQGPLYLAGDSAIGALGSARLIMGLPLFALVLWLSWRIIRRPGSAEVVPD